ncbi:DUF1642 domain-containing protein [Enterococcus gallinarum]|uniref:DUF1642 domain-containing protein n=1 Tax=Enterococcus gallinarum TaxID=1353 RepID=UPI000BBC3122|nr:DUF1642 domain-containing protein [Enterococcus gallinarum]PCD91547.1 hypothetical protein CKY18_15380 [Enterococcus gallinarum]
MNKQELIDNIEKLPYLGLNYNSQENVLFQQRKKILEVIKQLDVQAKETVPKFVADWIKQCKENAALADCLNGYYQISNGQVIESEDFQNWVVDNENDELTAKAWIFGYEVEKELLYKVIIDHKYLVQLFSGRTDARLVEFEELTMWSESAYKLTEETIKAIDERYWAFAVPVEEVK